jgi:gluconate 2-dehydrogenase subunit 3-like protein
MADGNNLTRRELIQITAVSAVAASAPSLGADQATKFFTADEFAMVDELTELIIPTDDHSPGARAAQVAAYIDARLAEAFEEGPRQRWREGLKRIDAVAQEMHGRPFLQASNVQRVTLLERISRNEKTPKTPEEHFFNELKGRTVHAYYTSKIGIHQEMEYKGNVYLEQFVGYEVK